MAVARLLFVLLATLLLVGDALALREAETFPHPTAGILLGLILGEVGLIASWAACARRSWMARAAIAWACAALAAWPLSLYSGPSWQAWAGLLLVYSMVVAGCWKLLLAAGYRFHRVDAPSCQRGGTLRPHQFSLRWMLQTITACAVALGIGSWLALPALHPFAALASIFVLAILVPLTLSTLLVETRRWWLRGALALIVPLGGAALLALNQGPSAMFLTLVLGVQTLTLLLAATVLAACDVALVAVTASTTRLAPALPLPPADAL